MKRSLVVMLGLALLLVPPTGLRSLADGPAWRPVSGPCGGSVAALALSPNYAADHTVFAGLRGHGVYRTADSGGSWQPVGPSHWVAVALAISPGYVTDATLFVSTGLPTTGFHVYRSDDEGLTWHEVTPAWASPPNAPGLAVSPDFTTDRTVYVLGGLDTYVSTDGGGTFAEAGGWLAEHNVVELAFSPGYGADRTLFALVRGDGLFKSTDGGVTWNPTGLSGDFSTFAVSPAYADDHTLLAAGRSDGALVISNDGGAGWMPVGVALGAGGQHTLLFSPSFATDHIILAAGSAGSGIHRSDDGGATWSLVGKYDPLQPYVGGFIGGEVYALALAPAGSYDASAFAGTSSGLYQSSDWGTHWYPQNDGLARLTVRALAVASGDPSTLLAGTSFFHTRINGQPDEHDGNLQLSTDGGQTWRVVSGRMARVRGVAFSPGFATDRTAFAATGTPGEHGLSEGGVYRSTDGGVSWTEVFSGSLVAALALSPGFSDDHTLWASTFSGGVGMGIYVSSDGGDGWTPLPAWVPAEVLVPSPSYAVDHTLFAGGRENGLWKLAGGDVFWTQVLTRPITALAFSPAYGASRTLYAGVKDDAGAAGEVYRSTDRGATWQRLETGIAPTWGDKPATISALSFASDGSIMVGVYYGHEAGGGDVYRSVDGGQTWQLLGSGLGAYSVFALTAAPGRALTFYAGTDGGLWRTEVVQGGPAEPGTWVSGGPRGGRAQALAVSPDFVSDGVAFAGSWLYGKGGGASGLGILRSTDGGQTWQPSSSGTEEVYYSSAVHAYAFSPDFGVDRTVFAATWGGLFKSADGGENWQWLTRLYFGPPGSITAAAVAPDYATSGHVLAGGGWGGVFTSQDGGIHWTANYSVTGGAAVAYSPGFVHDQVAFAGGSSGLFKTSDRGAGWTQVLTRPVAALAVSPQFEADGTLFVGGDALYVSSDGGGSWVSTTVATEATYIKALAISPDLDQDRTLFAGTNSGLYRSADGGVAWEPVAGYPGRAVLALVISPGWPDHPVLLAGTEQGVYLTMDGGATWIRGEGLATLPTRPIALDSTGNLLLTGAPNYGVYGSTDGGIHWLPLGLQGGGWYYSIPDVAISPAYVSDGTLFAAWASSVSIGGGIYQTMDGGATWEQVYSTDYITELAISPGYADDRTVYAAGHGGRVVRSTDGGETWDLVGNWPSDTYTGIVRVALPPSYPMDSTVFAGGQGFWRLLPGATDWELAAGLDNSYYVESIAVSPSYAADRTLLATASWFAGPAGPLAFGVFRSTDGGANWQPANAGLPDREEVRVVAFSPYYGMGTSSSDRTAYVTSGARLYRSLDGGQGWTDVGGLAGWPELYDVAVGSAGEVYVASDTGVWRYTATAQDIVVNGSFEAGGGWSMPETPRPAGYSEQVVYDGRRAVRVGIVNSTNAYAYSSVQQGVIIPTDTLTATLGLYVYPVSSEPAAEGPGQVLRRGSASGSEPALLPGAAPEDDTQWVLLLQRDAPPEILLRGLSNGQGWQHHTFDLAPYAGQAITIYLGVYNDGTEGWTGMYVDDVSLVVARRVVDMPVHAYLPLVVKRHPDPR